MTNTDGQPTGPADDERNPGAWPVPRTELRDLPDPEPVRDTQTRARFTVTLGSVRADLEEQPSPATVRSAGRRWTAAIAHLTEDVAQAKAAASNKEGDQ